MQDLNQKPVLVFCWTVSDLGINFHKGHCRGSSRSEGGACGLASLPVPRL